MRNKSQRRNKMRKLKLVLFIVLDVLTVVLAWVFSAYLLHYDLQTLFAENYFYLIGGVLVMLGANVLFGLYYTLWVYASVRDIFKIIVKFIYIVVGQVTTLAVISQNKC